VNDLICASFPGRRTILKSVERKENYIEQGAFVQEIPSMGTGYLQIQSNPKKLIEKGGMRKKSGGYRMYPR